MKDNPKPSSCNRYWEKNSHFHFHILNNKYIGNILERTKLDSYKSYLKELPIFDRVGVREGL